MSVDLQVPKRDGVERRDEEKGRDGEGDRQEFFFLWLAEGMDRGTTLVFQYDRAIIECSTVVIRLMDFESSAV